MTLTLIFRPTDTDPREASKPAPPLHDTCAYIARDQARLDARRAALVVSQDQRA